jgi:predicted nucleic acid-binding protein
VIVVDAGVMASALVDDGERGSRTRLRLAMDELAAPELIDIEVTSVLRRLVAAGRLQGDRAEQALADLVSAKLVRSPHAPLLRRCWELRDDVTTYDAVYVAMAEALGTVLVTSDSRLAAAPGPRCRFEVLAV